MKSKVDNREVIDALGYNAYDIKLKSLTAIDVLITKAVLRQKVIREHKKTP